MAFSDTDPSSEEASRLPRSGTWESTTSSFTPNRPRRSGTNASIQSARQTVLSATDRILDADVPLGMWAATASVTSKAPTNGEIQRGSFGPEGWDPKAQRDHRKRSSTTSSNGERTGNGRGFASRRSSAVVSPVTPTNGAMGVEHMSGDRFGPVNEEHGHISDSENEAGTLTSAPNDKITPTAASEQSPTTSTSSGEKKQPHETTARRPTHSTIPDGYIEPPRKPWPEATKIGFLAFCKWLITPSGFLIALYGANVVAWGGMLFLLLCNASPAMCAQNTAENAYDGCNDINSPRRIWLEIDSQILNALFCVTGFGLIPWRFRDLYWLLRFRLTNEKSRGRAAKMLGLRRLAGIHNGWFRLPGSDTLDEMSTTTYMESVHQPLTTHRSHDTADEAKGHVLIAGDEDTESLADERIPLPLSKRPADPMTSVRARPTKVWLMDFVIWCNVWNTFLQACLCGFMWGMNRYKRPSWSTGLFIALACIVAGVGGVVMFVQGKRVKRVEGVAPEGWERQQQQTDVQMKPLRSGDVKDGQRVAIHE